jgi:ABC-type methionine transport system ATPase subunit
LLVETIVIDHVSLHADRGETLVVVGAAGAGKSTLIRQFAGLERPAFADSSGFEPKKRAASRASRRKPAQIREQWQALQSRA